MRLFSTKALGAAVSFPIAQGDPELRESSFNTLSRERFPSPYIRAFSLANNCRRACNYRSTS